MHAPPCPRARRRPAPDAARGLRRRHGAATVTSGQPAPRDVRFPTARGAPKAPRNLEFFGEKLSASVLRSSMVNACAQDAPAYEGAAVRSPGGPSCGRRANPRRPRVRRPPTARLTIPWAAQNAACRRSASESGRRARWGPQRMVDRRPRLPVHDSSSILARRRRPTICPAGCLTRKSVAAGNAREGGNPATCRPRHQPYCALDRCPRAAPWPGRCADAGTAAVHVLETAAAHLARDHAARRACTG